MRGIGGAIVVDRALGGLDSDSEAGHDVEKRHDHQDEEDRVGGEPHHDELHQEDDQDHRRQDVVRDDPRARARRAQHLEKQASDSR